MTKKNFKIAKSLFKQSLDENGYVDKSKVRQILKKITTLKPQQLTSILKTYRRLVETAVSKEQVILESSGKITNRNLENELLKKTGARKIIHRTSPNLVFGAKITHGDWVWEETLDSKLKQLTTNI